MAQQGGIIPSSSSSTFPGCALSCTVLLQAQDLCMPPNEPQSNQLTYDQCFCNSALLTSFASTAPTVCTDECTLTSDKQSLQGWYNTFCANVDQGVDPTTLTQTSTASTPTATATVDVTSGTVTATATPTSTSSGSSAIDSSSQQQTWIAGHWKYILMLAILAIALVLLAWLAVWLKRRHHRKLEKQRAVVSGFNHDPEKRPAKDIRSSATPDLWGPHQMMQATQGYGYSTDVITEDAGKSSSSKKYRGAEAPNRLTKDAIEIAELDRGRTGSRPSTRRARPSELETNARMIGAADRSSKRKHISGAHNQEPHDKDIEAGRVGPSTSRSNSEHAEKDLEKT